MGDIVTKSEVVIPQTPKKGQAREIKVARKDNGRGAEAIDVRQYTEGVTFSKEGVWMNLEVAVQVFKAQAQMLLEAGVDVPAILGVSSNGGRKTARKVSSAK